jgi:hypothetical protein
MKPRSKAERLRDTSYARGGQDHMAGKGTRTTTAPSDAANTQAQGVTGHKTSGGNLKSAKGGSRTSSAASLPKPAAPGHTAPPTKGR